jgi:hypothetical protein
VGTRLRTPQSFACPSGEFTVSRGNERWTAAAPLRVAATSAGWQVTAKGSARSFAAGPLELRPIGKASIEWDGAGWPGVATLVALPCSGVRKNARIKGRNQHAVPGEMARQMSLFTAPGFTATACTSPP